MAETLEKFDVRAAADLFPAERAGLGRKNSAMGVRSSEMTEPKEGLFRWLVSGAVRGWAGPAAVALLLAALFSGFNRPIWIDEFLHFALAGVSWQEIFAVIQDTSGNINHGQTWAAQVASLASLKTFGASELALRFPTLIANALAVFASIRILAMLGVPPIFHIGLLGVITAIGEFEFQMGNARPYMPLLMFTVLTLWTLVELTVRRRLRRLHLVLFPLAVVAGAASHPYFPAVLITLLGGFFVLELITTNDGFGAVAMRYRFVSLWSASGVVTSIAIGSYTWLRGSPEFPGMDPFSWFPLGLGLQGFVLLSVAFAGSSVIMATQLRRLRDMRCIDRAGWVGLLLLFVGPALALIFSWISLARGYWILARQWLPGALLFFLGATILGSIVFRLVSAKLASRSRHLLEMGSLACVLLVIGYSVSNEVEEIEANHAYWEALDPADLMTSSDRASSFVVAANLNMKCGGPVWTELSSYYADLEFPDWQSLLSERGRNCRDFLEKH